MKIILFCLFLSPCYLLAKNVYVDALSGRDNLTGTEAAPYRSIQKAADVMVAGDICYIKKGIYRETITPKSSGLTFKNFNNEYVLITGLDLITNWEAYEKGIMKTGSDKKITQVFVDGKRMNWARYPNEDGNMFNITDMDSVNIHTEEPTGLVTFSKMESKPVDYWKGGWFVGQPTNRNWWTAHRGLIASSTGKTITATDLSRNWFNPKSQFTGHGAGYIIGTLAALDTMGEWHWQEKTLYLYPPKGIELKNKIVEGRTRIHGFNISGVNKITLEGLHFKAADIHMPKSDSSTINKCTVRYPGIFSTFFINSGTQREAWGDFENGASGIYVGGDHNLIVDSYVGKTWSHGVSLWGNFNTLKNSTVEGVNWMGERMSAVWVPGNDNKVIHNTIRESGRDGIELGNNNFFIKYARRALIQFNHVYNISYFCPDAGFLYTNHQGGTNEYANTDISYNIMHDLKFRNNNSAHGGIYLDNGSSGYKIHHNVIWNSKSGIHINDLSISHRPTGVHVYNNTLVDVIFAINWNKGGPTARIITRNNLGTVQSFEGTTTSNNLKVSVDVFKNHAERDYSLNKGVAPIDAGIHIDGITVDTIGPPDLGAFEYGIPKWKAGSDITIPIFIDETGELAKLPDATTSIQRSSPFMKYQLKVLGDNAGEVHIRNIKGELLFSFQRNNFKIEDIPNSSNFSKLPSGMYLIELKTSDGVRKKSTPFIIP